MTWCGATLGRSEPGSQVRIGGRNFFGQAEEYVPMTRYAAKLELHATSELELQATANLELQDTTKLELQATELSASAGRRPRRQRASPAVARRALREVRRLPLAAYHRLVVGRIRCRVGGNPTWASLV